MNFETLFKRISPRLKAIARSRRGYGFFIDEDDLYQEMCLYLWNNSRGGLTDGFNEAYVIGGCRFHLLNYLRKKREKVKIISLETPVGEDGAKLEDILPDSKESLGDYIDRKVTIADIENNGISKREKQVFSLLRQGCTTREAGRKLGISHVMVIKCKQGIIKKWRSKI